MTFPLPVVPFERYMLAENTLNYPRVFVIEAMLSGDLDRVALETAWRASLARHPMLCALLAKTRRGWAWTALDDSPRPMHWAGHDAPIEFTGGEIIDLSREAGVRLWVRAGAGAARLVMQFHHACCDGMGALQFIGDLLALYARQTCGDGDAPTLPTLEPTLLNDRGTFGLARPTFREWLGHAAYMVKDSLRLVARSPIPVSAPRSRNGEPTALGRMRGMETQNLAVEEVDELRRTARSTGATVNDLLMCYLFKAIIDWNLAQGDRAPRGWLRINVPTNLRRREDLLMPAANVMSFTFVDRHTRDCRDARALLESIRRETEAIKGKRLGLYFIAQLASLSAIPGGMRFMLGQRCLATAVLSNVGDPTRAFSAQFPRQGEKLVVGNLVLENIVGIPPLRPLTRVAIAVLNYAGRLSINLLCDRHCFSEEQAREFLDTYVARIRQGL